MKKLLVVLGLSLMIMGCQKEEIKPVEVPKEDCSCGFIVEDNWYEARYDPYVNYWVKVKNDCSGNVKLFGGFESSNKIGADYDGHVGEDFCHHLGKTW